MPSYILTVASVLVLLSSCLGQDRRYIEIQTGLPIIEDVLREAKVSGSLVYQTRCNGSPNFPRVHAPRTQGASPVKALREVFADYPLMRVWEDGGGKIRMVETGVLRDLLDVKIGQISFNVSGPQMALHFILATPEVRAFMREQRIGPIEGDTFAAPGNLGPDQPLVLGDLNNVTVSQALDYLVQTYPGFWIYATCPGKEDPGARIVALSFAETLPPIAQSMP